MKKYRGLWILVILVILSVGIVWLTLRVTAQYPSLGEPVSYPVNQVAGFTLSIEEPTWSPFRGYTIHYTIEINSEEIYYLAQEDSSFEYLERLEDGQWYRLSCQREREFVNTNIFDLGGNENTGFGGSIVQKYQGYGTRLERGTYRLTIEMTAQDGTNHYLAAKFDIH